MQITATKGSQAPANHQRRSVHAETRLESLAIKFAEWSLLIGLIGIAVALLMLKTGA